MPVAGGMLALAGLVLAARSALLLAGRGRPKRGPTPRFIIAGPYRRMRNPLYVGVLLALGGLALATRWTELAMLTAALAVGLHLWVIHREEPSLRSHLGDAYEAYLLAVPRWVPRWRAP